MRAECFWEVGFSITVAGGFLLNLILASAGVFLLFADWLIVRVVRIRGDVICKMGHIRKSMKTVIRRKSWPK